MNRTARRNAGRPANLRRETRRCQDIIDAEENHVAQISGAAAGPAH